MSSARRSRSTWSTGQTRRNRPSAKSVSGSAISRLVLASKSPRRRALLEALGLEFELLDPGIEELTEGDPAEVVIANALSKARAGIERAPGATVIGADTEVAVDGEVLGKPNDEAEARQMLTRLSGREHEVHGGVAVIGADGESTTHTLTRVRFAEVQAEILDAYIAAGAWRGYAGAYAIQGLGSMLVDSVTGDVANVIGLPVRALIELAPGLLGPDTP